MWKLSSNLLTRNKFFHQKLRTFSAIQTQQNRVVVLDGSRTPFCKSSTLYSNSTVEELASIVMRNIVQKNKIPLEEIDYCIFGNVLQFVCDHNLARDALIGSFLPSNIPSYTVSMGCLSSLYAITSAFNMIKVGSNELIITGGAEYLSDIPIQLSKTKRRFIVKIEHEDSIPFEFPDKVSDMFNKSYDFPSITENTTGLSMINHCEQMCQIFDVTREESDAYALLSFQRSLKASQNNKHTDKDNAILSYSGDVISNDNVIRETTLEELSHLQSVASISNNVTKNKDVPHSYFPPPAHGILTAGNSSGRTDGASATILMSESKARELNLTPKAIICDYVLTANDTKDFLLMGPCRSVPKLLARNNLTFDDIGVFEIHEAFAGQILCFLKAINDKEFLKEFSGVTKDLGTLRMEQINLLGGSISLGHPFAATGSRLVNTAVNQLVDLNEKYALVTSCSSGGQSIAILLERC